MESRRAHAADVHAGTPADGLQAFEDGDVAGGVLSHCAVRIVQL
jgi:hypothetical protein